MACVTKDTAYVAKLEEVVTNGFDCPTADNEHFAGRTLGPQILRLDDKCMEPLIEHILAARPWRFHTHNYIGAAHGVIGIITQVVLSDPERASTIEPQLSELLDLQGENGHWFITDNPKLGEHDLVHFCHGSPGFVASLMKLRQFFPANMQKRFDVALERGRRKIWERGLLTKDPKLCHGIMGNMLAFEDWEQRKHFMALATMEEIAAGKRDGKFIKGDDRFGLMWGEAGRAWGWMIMDSGRDLGYPSHTDI